MRKRSLAILTLFLISRLALAESSPEQKRRPPLMVASIDEGREFSRVEREAQRKTQRRRTKNIGVGWAGGKNYSFPLLHFQFAVSEKVSLGVMPLYLSSEQAGVSQKAFGGFLTASYYFSHAPFLGFFAQGAVGLYGIEAENDLVKESATSPAVSFLLGWRAKTPYRVNVGFSAGLQYVISGNGHRLIDYSGVLPLLAFDLSLSF